MQLMPVPPELFDDDYLYFYADQISAGSDTDAELVWRLLELEPGLRVLDVPCGEGRISGRLAGMGCEVVGVDYTEAWVELARKQYPGATFEVADMRSLAYDQEFDAVVNWFTSFGYFDPQTNDDVLARFARALRPGGRLLIELHNPWRLQRLLAQTGGHVGVRRRQGRRADGRPGQLRQRTANVAHRAVHRPRRKSAATSSSPSSRCPALSLPTACSARDLRRSICSGTAGARSLPGSRRLIAVAHKGDAASERPPISLREIDADNVRAVCELDVAPSQQTHVARNALTVAESAYEPNAWLRGIYAGDEPVGLLGLVADTETPEYWLARLMIAGAAPGARLRPRRDGAARRARAHASRARASSRPAACPTTTDRSTSTVGWGSSRPATSTPASSCSG